MLPNVVHLGYCLALFTVVLANREEDLLLDMLKEGFGNIEKETINEEVTIEYGAVPKWLAGRYFEETISSLTFSNRNLFNNLMLLSFSLIFMK